MLGLKTVRGLTEEFPQIPILIVSSERSRQIYDEARKAGVRGYWLSSETFWSFVLVVRSVLAGCSYFLVRLVSQQVKILITCTECEILS